MKKIYILLNIILLINSLINQLSFSGGGSFGALEIGILKKVIEDNNLKKFDLYTGISSGALNAGFLSYYNDINIGINNAEYIYSKLKNNMIYTLAPTKNSILNTKPLYLTLLDTILQMPNKPVIHTVIGATNIYSGKLDIFNFEDQTDQNKILLLMASSAIPCIFPPIKFNNKLYADGGLLTNELLNVKHDNDYLNITFITPYDDFVYNDKEVKSINDIICRTISIIISNFNNPLSSLNENCYNPIGEINKYYVPSHILKNYNILNFNNCYELIDIGYKNMIHKRYIIC
jgi:predicted patatin/cPLA2 family phospholipase